MPKRLELLRELVSAMTRVAVFVNPANPARAEFLVREAESAGRTMGLRIQVFNTGTIREINAAFTALASQRPDALLVTPDSSLPGARKLPRWQRAMGFQRRFRRATMSKRAD